VDAVRAAVPTLFDGFVRRSVAPVCPTAPNGQVSPFC